MVRDGICGESANVLKNGCRRCTVVQEDVILSEIFSEPINVTLAATKHVL